MGRAFRESPESTRALQWFVYLQLEHHVVPNATLETAEPGPARFINGQLAMLIETRRIVPGTCGLPPGIDRQLYAQVNGTGGLTPK